MNFRLAAFSVFPHRSPPGTCHPNSTDGIAPSSSHRVGYRRGYWVLRWTVCRCQGSKTYNPILQEDASVDTSDLIRYIVVGTNYRMWRSNMLVVTQKCYVFWAAGIIRRFIH